ncbi:hypothetical protein HGRIS_008048 [Hohenbuehelia grisea]|uniref:Uncharacterized protein n=1 Tax=Hohenbuehelia grisea TaxID=104357 RepID=A0ABR3J6S0_9AGAR
MDAVFGEDAREEAFDNESERASLVSNALPTYHQARSSSAPRAQRGWLSRVLNKDDGRAAYEPISTDE